MKYDLAGMARRTRNIRRRTITIRDIAPPATLATNLYTAAYFPIIDLWTRHGTRIAEEYARTIAAMTTDSPADLQAALDAADSEFERLFITLRAGIEGWALSTEKWARGKWRGAVLSATGVDVGTMIGAEDVRGTIQSAIEWNAGLVKDVQAQARQKISNAVFTGLNQRRTAADVAKDIREATGFARDRSRRIASDQLTKITSSLAEERQREAGITEVEWKSSHKLHPRPHHAARDGKVYDLETHKAVEGGEVVEAGDWVGQPPFCGCRSLARISFD